MQKYNHHPALPKDTKVLIVDDDVRLCELYAIVLEEEGCQIATAGSVEQAQLLIESMEFDIIVCDINLGGLDEDGRRLLSCFPPGARKPCLIFLTGDTSFDTAQVMLETGTFACLQKGIDFPSIRSDLLATVRRAKSHLLNTAAPPIDAPYTATT